MLALELPAIFVFGSIMWFVLLGAALILAAWAVDSDSGYGFTAVLGGYFVISAAAGDFNIITWVTANPLVGAGILGLYIAIGAAWAIFKWSLYVSDKRHELDDYTEKWLADRGIEDKKVPDNLKAEFTKTLLNNQTYSYNVGHGSATVRKIRLNPVWRENKARATKWACMWPLSAFLTVFKDFFRVMFRSIMDRLGKIADSISTKKFKDAEDNFFTEEELKEKEEKEENEKVEVEK